MLLEHAKLAEPDPEFVKILQQTKTLPPNASLDPLVRRKVFADNLAAIRTAHPPQHDFPDSAIIRKELTIPVADAVEIKVLSLIPSPTSALGESEGHLFPLFFWAHGGAFSIGDHLMDEVALTDLAHVCRISVLSIDYRLAPEHPFPNGLNDSYAALKWAAANAAHLRADLTKGFIVGGASSGANFAAVLSHLARDDPGFTHTVTGQFLIIPLLITPGAITAELKEELYSRDQNADAPLLTKQSIQISVAAYNPPDETDPRVSPALLSSHKGLPPAYIQVAGFDPIRDDGFLYERLLNEAEVPVRLDAYQGVPHAFMLVFPMLSATRKAYKDGQMGVQWLLGGAV